MNCKKSLSLLLELGRQANWWPTHFIKACVDSKETCPRHLASPHGNIGYAHGLDHYILLSLAPPEGLLVEGLLAEGSSNWSAIFGRTPGTVPAARLLPPF